MSDLESTSDKSVNGTSLGGLVERLEYIDKLNGKKNIYQATHTLCQSWGQYSLSR